MVTDRCLTVTQSASEPTRAAGARKGAAVPQQTLVVQFEREKETPNTVRTPTPGASCAGCVTHQWEVMTLDPNKSNVVDPLVGALVFALGWFAGVIWARWQRPALERAGVIPPL